MNKSAGLSVCALCVVIGVAAQQPQTSKGTTAPSEGKVTGSVFLKTEAGDLNPARLAWVLLLYFKKSGETRVTPGTVYMDARNPNCQASTALESTFEWMEHDERKPVQFLDTHTDEEGRFKISAPPGTYILIVWAGIGEQATVWEKYDVAVEAEQTTALKLSAPGCLHMKNVGQ